MPRRRSDVCGRLLSVNLKGEHLGDFCGEPAGHGFTGPTGVVGSPEHKGKWNGIRWTQDTRADEPIIVARQEELPDHKTAEPGERA
jgi:hypothetical protein